MNSIVTSKNESWPRLIWPTLYNALFDNRASVAHAGHSLLSVRWKAIGSEKLECWFLCLCRIYSTATGLVIAYCLLSFSAVFNVHQKD